MKVTVMKEALAHALALVSRATATKSTLPILVNILLETREGQLALKATNLEVSVAVAIPARIEEPGVGTVPARVFTDFIAALNGDTIELGWVSKTATLNVHCGAFRSRIKGIDAAEFPLWPGRGDKDTLIVFNDVPGLATTLNQVGIAAAKEVSRPVLTGVCAVVAPASVTFAAADGFRLAVKGVAAITQPAPAEPFRIIIPSAAVKLMREVCDDVAGSLEMRVNPEKSQAAFLAPNVEIFAGLIDGAYPEFERLIPQTSVSRVTIARDELSKALKAGKPFAEKSRIDFAVKPENQVAVISTQAAQDGDSAAELACAADGETLSLALSGNYLADALGTLGTPQVCLEFTGTSSPAVLRAVGDADFICVIMPMVESGGPVAKPPPTPPAEVYAPEPQSPQPVAA